MKRILFLIPLFAVSAFSQALTPNLGLQLPAYGQIRWDVPMNFNSNVLDSVLLQQLTNPGIVYSTGSTHSRAATSLDVGGLWTGTNCGTSTNAMLLNGNCAVPGTGTVSSVGFTGGLISVANPTSTPALTVAGTSGGIPYFNAGNSWLSSGALTQYGVLIGGGAGGAPTSTAASTTTTQALFATATAPAFRGILQSDLPITSSSGQLIGNLSGTIQGLSGVTSNGTNLTAASLSLSGSSGYAMTTGSPLIQSMSLQATGSNMAGQLFLEPSGVGNTAQYAAVNQSSAINFAYINIKASTSVASLGVGEVGSPTYPISLLNIGEESGSSALLTMQFTFGGTAKASISSAGLLSAVDFQGTTIYSAAGTPLPTCNSDSKGTQAAVSDATTPTYLGAYASGGAVNSPVFCNGAQWVTY